jgi:hypothetical protein
MNALLGLACSMIVGFAVATNAPAQTFDKKLPSLVAP